MKYRAEIDGLRSVAVLPVIFFHAGFDFFNGGYVGVDVFFVISGYLITTILIEDLENNSFNIINFYERRARRILPAIFFMMLLCMPLTWLLSLPNHFKDFSQGLVAVSLFISNFLFWKKSGYFESNSDENPLLHTWSLAVEEQYYLLFPIFLFLAWKFGKKSVFWMIVVIAVASFLLSEWGSRNYAVANFYLIPTRAWELLAGSLTAFIIKKHGIKASNFLSFLGFGLIAFSIFAFNKETPFPSFYTMIPVLGTVLLILYADQDIFIAKVLRTKVLVSIGLISYSAYLFHQPIFAFARIYLLHEPTHLIMISLSIFSILIASFSWKFIEQPFRKKNKKIQSQKIIFSLSAIFIIFFVSAGLIGNKNDGFPKRFTKFITGDVGQLDFFKYINKYQDCEVKNIFDNAQKWNEYIRCKQTKNGKPNIILLGDSHAEHLFLGLAESLINKNVTFYTLNGEPYYNNVQFKNIFEELKNNNLKQTIFLTMNYSFRLEKNNDLLEGFNETIIELKKMKKDVVLIGDIPSYTIEPAFCVYKTYKGKVDSKCSISKEKADKQKNNYHKILGQLSKKHNVSYIEIDEPLCGNRDCSMIKNNKILYRDKHHLNILGSILIGNYIREKLKAEKILNY